MPNTIKVFAGDPNGVSGSDPGEFGAGVHGIKTVGNWVYAGDPGNDRVQIFDLSGNFVVQLTDASMDSITDIAVDPTGNVVYVMDNGASSYVHKFSYVHNGYSTYTHSNPSVVGSAKCIAVDASGTVYVAKNGSGSPQTVTVTKYDQLTLDFDSSFTVDAPSSGPTVYPYGLDITSDPNNTRMAITMSGGTKHTVTYTSLTGTDPCQLDVSSVVGESSGNTATDNDGNIWWITLYFDVSWIHEIFLLDQLDGSLIMPVDNNDLDDIPVGEVDWQWDHAGAAVAEDGTVYISDYRRIVSFDPCDMPNTIQVFAGNPDNSAGTGDGEFWAGITGIEVVGGKVYACDPGNSRVQVFDKDTGDFIQKLTDPCNDQWQDIAVDSVGNVYVNSPGIYADIFVFALIANDTDLDGVTDPYDLCPGSDANYPVNWEGCLDTDEDGVRDTDDRCANTPLGVEVDQYGCPTQSRFVSALTNVTATAWGDYNNDDYADMIGKADVYTNDGDGTFTKTTPFSGLNAISLGDWNNDGYLDVFSNNGDPKLFTNDGDETWTNDNSIFAAATDPANCSTSTWGDWNGDGWLDTYSTGWYSGYMNDVIYMNNEGLNFHQSWQAPSGTDDGKGVMGCDFDEDGDIDIYVSNYWLDYGYLWLNSSFDGNTGLSDVRSARGADDGPGHTQGSTWADFDNDGDFDLFISNFAHSYNPTVRFLRNNGAPNWNFTNLGQQGVARMEPVSGSTTADINNDGYLDLVITTSSGYSPPNKIVVYSNNGDFTFTDVTSDVNLDGLGPDDHAAFGDYNNDGHMDLIVANTLYKNLGTGNHWLKVRLIGGEHASGLVNEAAIGAQVRIESYTGLGTLTRQVQGNTGAFGMQNDQVLHFGLGPDPCATYDLQIDWPNGYSETIQDVNIDEYTVIELYGGDLDAPTPNPAAFSSAPAADSDTAISMTATTGSDPCGPVEYYFDETSLNPGGTDSGWQASASYTDTGLTESTQYTYTVQMRDSVTPTPNTGTASSPANATTDAAPGGASLTQKFQEWAATTADTWEDQDLSGYGVPANAVVEIAVRNSSASAQRWGGVRANGSGVDRRVQLREAESGGWTVVTMHVQADGSSIIEHYADNTGQVKFYLLGYWSSGTYVEKYEGALTAGSDSTWADEDLSGYGVGSGDICEIMLVNNNASNEYEAGVRKNGSSLSRKIDICKAEGGGDEIAVMLVEADGSSLVELYAESNSNITFYVLGYWSTAPGSYTEKFESVGKPASDNTWGDRDLSAYGVSDGSVCEILMANGNGAAENQMGVRDNGSADARILDIHEPEDGGRALGRMLVTADSSSIIEQRMEDVSDTGEFHLLGYWD